MQKAIIISCFDWYNSRLKYIENFLINLGYSVLIVTSDYNHIKKTKEIKKEGIYYIQVRPYKKNLSFTRMYSHYGFSKKIFKLLQKEQPNFVYALLPPNSVAWACGKYKRKRPESKLVFDIIDMWPESYTARRFFNVPFKLWANLRNYNLKLADHIFTECNLYHTYLNANLTSRLSTLYLCREELLSFVPKTWDGKNIDIAYLGSINNIIDIPLISKLLVSLSKIMKVTFHIIGGGEKKDLLMNSMNNKIKVIDYGIIFDKPRMRKIISECHFAINMMKPSVCVGLTIKSMDYFQIGIPILNTIKGDTTDIIIKYNSGFNVYNVKEIVEQIVLLDDKSYGEMRKNTHKVFFEMFTVDVFKKEVNRQIRNLL